MNRLRRFEYIRGLAILCVVVMHNTLEYVYYSSDILIDAFLHNLVTVGVPLFLFLSGYFLVQGHENGFWEFIKNKIRRIYFPAILWVVVFWFVFSIYGSHRSFDWLGLIFDVVFLR